MQPLHTYSYIIYLSINYIEIGLQGLQACIAASGHKPLTPSALHHRLIRIGQRAGVSDIQTHRFRYTFAVQYIRNGGDAFTLQTILGHTTMEMVTYYIRLAQADLEQAHRRASPVDNWLKKL